MNQETQAELARARSAAQDATGRADEQIESLLKALTAGLVERAEAIARGATQSEPDVTRALGRDGIAALRADVTAAAEALAVEVKARPEMFTWPLPQGAYASVTANDVRSAIFNAWYGRRVDAIAAAIGKHGFNRYRGGADRADRHQDLVLPQSLYGSELEAQHFQSLADAQNALGAAQLAVKTATAAVDREAADALWD